MEANDNYCTSLTRCVGFIIQKIPANQKNKPRKTIQITVAAPLHTLKIFRTVGDPPKTGAEVAEVFLHSNKRLKVGPASS